MLGFASARYFAIVLELVCSLVCGVRSSEVEGGGIRTKEPPQTTTEAPNVYFRARCSVRQTLYLVFHELEGGSALVGDEGLGPRTLHRAWEVTSTFEVNKKNGPSPPKYQYAMIAAYTVGPSTGLGPRM